MARETFISLKFKLIGEIVKPEVGKSQCKSQILVTDVADMYQPQKHFWDVADMYRRFEMSQICIERCRRYVSPAAKTFLPAAEKMRLMAQEALAGVDFN